MEHLPHLTQEQHQDFALHHYISNISSHLYDALSTREPNLVIKHADKQPVVLVKDRSRYLRQEYQHLSDANISKLD